MISPKVAEYLNQQYVYYSRYFDISLDPISIPKKFSRKQDIEISGFFAATLAWGNRTAILKSANELMSLMDFAPYDFILNHRDEDLKSISKFYYRTYNATDLLYFVSFLKHHYSTFDSLEYAFLASNIIDNDFIIKKSLMYFYNYFFSLEFAPDRTRKHIGNVCKNSACKRLNMFLRWMVRDTDIDFGIWQQIPKAKLIIPLDVHVQRVAQDLGILERKQADWKAAVDLTKELLILDPLDPVKYDLALFSLGVEQRLLDV